MKENHYPEKLINNVIYKYQHKIKNDKPAEISEFDISKVISIPYYNGLSDDIAKIMKEYDIKVVFKQGIRLRNILNNNNKRSILNRHNVVYDLSCKDCDEIYVGQTKRKLGIRIFEHKKAKAKHSLKSNVAEHALKNNHDVD